MPIRTFPHVRIKTTAGDGHANGFLVPIYNIHDGIFASGAEPKQVYLSVVAPRETKGPHLHHIRTGYFTCIKGNVKIILKDRAGKYETLLSGESYDYLSVEVPVGVAAAIHNCSDREEAFVLNMPCPAWTPGMQDEHSADFSDYYDQPVCHSEGSSQSSIMSSVAAKSEDIVHRNTCRVCSGTELVKVLDLGSVPPANSFVKDFERGEIPRFPLQLHFCKSCGLIQLRDTVHPNLLYRHYDYMTSASGPLVEYFAAYGAELTDRFVAKPEDLVVEIGGNDGALLCSMKSRCRVLNVDPAEEIAEIARKRGLSVVTDFFSDRVARLILESHGHAKIVVASNVLAHMDDHQDVFRGVTRLIGDSGVFAVEVHWIGNLIGDGGFDQIYHEHLCYFSLSALQRLATKHGLTVFEAKLTPMHGTSLRVFMARSRTVLESVDNILEQERRIGLDRLETYRAFASRVEVNRAELTSLLRALKANGAVIMGYGAPAKGNTLLDSCGLDYRTIDYIIDTTPFKQGLYTPGGHIPVLHPDEMKCRPPDYALLLAWNYAQQILAKETEFRARGGRFIVPVPKPQIQ